jgi:hypothetical protein
MVFKSIDVPWRENRGKEGEELMALIQTFSCQEEEEAMRQV